MSAIMLCFPLICWEYNAASFSIRIVPNQRATLSCINLLVKLALCSQPRALELSVNARIFWGKDDCAIAICMVIAAARNSSKLIDNFPQYSIGNSYLQANPSLVYPPIPCSHASEYEVMVGSVKVMLLMSTPSLATILRMWCQ